MDLRRRVSAALDGGSTIRAAAQRFGVSPSFVAKLKSRVRRTRSLQPDPQGGDHRSQRVEAHAAWLLGQVRATLDITLVELCEGLESRGVRTVPSTVWRFLDRHKMTFKKRPRMRANKSGRM
jgi:transposase